MAPLLLNFHPTFSNNVAGGWPAAAVLTEVQLLCRIAARKRVHVRGGRLIGPLLGRGPLRLQPLEKLRHRLIIELPHLPLQGLDLGRPVWSPLSSPPNVEEKCGTRKKSMETWRQYLESFQKLPESFQELPESFREWFVNGL